MSPNEDSHAFWKDADPDIPILQQAKAEYARLLYFPFCKRLHTFQAVVSRGF